MIARLKAEWRLKFGMSFGLLSYWVAIYYGAQAVSPFTVRQFDLTVIDRLVTFQPAWVWGYAAIYPFVVVVPWLATRRDDLRRYALAMVTVIFVAGLFFFFFPVAGPRPSGVDANWLYDRLVSIDPVTNAFPSLHCAMATLAALFAGRALASPGAQQMRAIWRFAMWFLVAVILYSTLATKQHYFLDVVSGIALGAAGHWFARRLCTASRI